MIGGGWWNVANQAYVVLSLSASVELWFHEYQPYYVVVTPRLSAESAILPYRSTSCAELSVSANESASSSASVSLCV